MVSQVLLRIFFLIMVATATVIGTTVDFPRSKNTKEYINNFGENFFKVFRQSLHLIDYDGDYPVIKTLAIGFADSPTTFLQNTRIFFEMFEQNGGYLQKYWFEVVKQYHNVDAIVTKTSDVINQVEILVYKKCQNDVTCAGNFRLAVFSAVFSNTQLFGKINDAAAGTAFELLPVVTFYMMTNGADIFDDFGDMLDNMFYEYSRIGQFKRAMVELMPKFFRKSQSIMEDVDAFGLFDKCMQKIDRSDLIPVLDNILNLINDAAHAQLRI
jgi:hypothetical protein